MKLISVVIKSLREQLRSFWVLLLSLSMGPFFIFVYYLITESSKPQYDILVINSDKGFVEAERQRNHGSELQDFFTSADIAITATPFVVQEIADKNEGLEKLRNKAADALIVIPESFSQTLCTRHNGDSILTATVEFTGDLTNTDYLISAVWANEMINEYALRATKDKRIIQVKETALGMSGNVTEFGMLVPGILILSLIMLMFTASIAFVSEVENKTILRLKLSRLSTVEYLGGVGIVQVLVGLVSVSLSLGAAIALGFQYEGSLALMFFIAGLTSISLIAFSLIIAAVTKSANEVLVVGNFPMFLFMFFTGAAFPIKSGALFTVAGYPINLQGLMTPYHAISALNKTLILDMGVASIIPEIVSMIILSCLYFAIGAVIFKHRHLKLA